MENQESASKGDRAGNIILGLILAVGLYYLYQFMYALDGMRAMSGRQPLFTWIHLVVPFIPTLVVGFLIIVGINSLMTRMGK